LPSGGPCATKRRPLENIAAGDRADASNGT
jgi:hypothetical protein